MKMPRTAPIYHVLPLLAVIAGGCVGRAPSWTPDEKANASHIFRSAKADIEATRIMNRLVQEGSLKVSDSVFGVVVALQRTALEEARMVRDEVLEKAAPGMAKPYREFYKQSLELRLAFTETEDNQASIRASQLHDKWVDWSTAHPPRVPK